MQKLPIGLQSFKALREDDYVYIDKTKYIKKLVDTGKYYFLSRPRRFGKSLFLDTLRQAFLGRRYLFEGLYLYEDWDWEVEYPVIHISFGAGVMRNLKELRLSEEELIRRHIEEHNIKLKARTIKDRFFELIIKLNKKYNLGTVVLIDEYDKPILDNITRKETAIEIREELKNFYSVLKDADEFLKLVFITGVTKFSKVSLFSGLNNLDDISVGKEYGAICGFTQEEFEKCFEERLVGVDLEGVRKWYDGYSWGGERVYNPFDILLYLSKQEFRNYWFEAATPTFLIRMIEERGYFIPEFEELEVSERIIGSFDIEYIELETLLFQTGYLTIKDIIKSGPITSYRLSYPNLEVRSSLTDYILEYFVQKISAKEKNRLEVYRVINRNDIEGLKDIFFSFFASIPHDWYRKNQLSGYEGYYASIFYCYFTALGLEVKAEDTTNHGRLDMAVIFEDRCYIFEFKVVELVQEEGSALAQIKKRGYADKYKSKFKDVYLIGVEFSSESRNIVGYEWEKVS